MLNNKFFSSIMVLGLLIITTSCGSSDKKSSSNIDCNSYNISSTDYDKYCANGSYTNGRDYYGEGQNWNDDYFYDYGYEFHGYVNDPRVSNVPCPIYVNPYGHGYIRDGSYDRYIPYNQHEDRNWWNLNLSVGLGGSY